MYMNEQAAIDNRRYKDNLTVSGIGYIAFGLWSCIRIFIQLTSDYSLMFAEATDFDINTVEFKLLIAFTVLIISAVIISVHFYVGLSAISYANGRKKLKIYPAVVIILELSAVLELAYYIVDLISDTDMFFTKIVTIIVQLTTVLILFDIARNLFGLKKLRSTKEQVT